MSDQPINIPLSAHIEGLGETLSGLEQIKRAAAGISEQDVSGKLREHIGAINSATAEVTKSTNTMRDSLSKSLADGAKSGADGAVRAVREMRQELQVEYEKMMGLGWKLKAGALSDLKTQGVSLSPTDALRLRADEHLTKSAPKLNEDDARALLGMGTRAEMSAFASSLKAQMTEDLSRANATAGFRAKSASRFNEDDTRTLLGMPSRDEMKSFASSLKAQMTEDVALVKSTDTLRARSATPYSINDYRALMGLPSEAESKAMSAQIKAQMEASSEATTASIRRQVALATATPAGPYSVSEGARIGAGKGPVEEVADAHKKLTQAVNDGISPTQRLAAEKAKLAADMRDLHSAARGLASGFNAMWLTWGNILPLMAGAAVSGAIVSSIKDYKDLEYQLKFVQAVASDTSVSMQDMMTAVGKTSIQFGVEPAKAAQGVLALAQAGLTASEALQNLSTVMGIAVLGEMSMEKAAVSLTGATYAFGTGLQSMEHIGDVYTKAANVSNTSVQSITESMKQASAVAQQYGLSVEDVGTALTAMAKRNIMGSAAGTAFNNLMMELATPKGDAKKVASQLKISLYDPATNDTKDFFGKFIPELREKLRTFDPQSQTFIMNTLTNNRAAKSLAALLGMSDEDLQGLRNQFKNATGTTARGVVELNDSLQGDLNKLKASFADALGVSAKGGSESLRESLVRLRDVVESDGFKAGVDALIRGFAGLISIASVVAEVLTSPAGLVGAFAASGTALYALSTAAFTASGAMGTLFAVLGTVSKFTFWVTLITGVALAVGYLWEKLSEKTPAEQASSNMDKLIKKQNEYNQSLLESIDRLKIKQGLEGVTATDVDKRDGANQLEAARRQLRSLELSRPTGGSALEEAAHAKKLFEARDRYAGLANKDEALRNAEEVGVARQNELRKLQEAAAQKEKDKLASLMPGGKEHLTEVADTRGHSATDNTLQTAMTDYQTELSLVKAKESDKLKLLNGMRSANLLSQEGFYAAEIALARRSEAAELEAITNGLDSIKAAYAKEKATINADPKQKDKPGALEKLDNTYQSDVAKLEAERQKRVDDANTREMLQEIAFRGQLNKARTDARAIDLKDSTNDARRKEAVETADKLRYASADEAAIITARATEQARLNKELEAYDKVTHSLTKSLQDDIELGSIGNETEKEAAVRLADHADEVLALTAARKKYRDELALLVPKQVDKAGADAAGKTEADKLAESKWQVGAKKALDDYARSANNVAKSTEAAFTKAFKGMEDALLKFVKTGELNFSDLANSIIDDLLRIAIQKSITGPLSSAMGASAGPGGWIASLFSANGNAFTGSGVQAFANGGTFSNGIFNTPTAFRFANGGKFNTGVMAEAGPEAVMPLTRGPSGKLGVQASGASGGNLTVNIIEAPEKAGKVERRSENGVDMLDVFVESVKSSIAGDIAKGSGAVPNAMARTYGLNRAYGA